MADIPQPSFRIAGQDDHAVVVRLLGDLVDELGPQETADRVKRMLDDDIRLNAAGLEVWLNRL